MEDSSSPYTGLPARQFWRKGVSEQHPLLVSDLYKKKFEINQDSAIATAGSCFAQHIAKNLRLGGYKVLDVEQCPDSVPDEIAKSYGYRLYSGRYGNIYTVRQLLQLVKQALRIEPPRHLVWQRDGKFFDALRPSVEPNGLDSVEEVIEHRIEHLRLVRKLLTQANLMIFTMGLTESWVHKESGIVLPTAPGTIAGSYSAKEYEFVNFTYPEILEDFVQVKSALESLNPAYKFLVTVSPVPLTATYCDQHVLSSTMYSKSVLRAVSGQLCNEFNNVDYFPSYELIASHFSKGFFYDSNLRTVSEAGVANVMRVFSEQHPPLRSADAEVDRAPDVDASSKLSGTRGGKKNLGANELVCEEALLEAFTK